MKAWWARAWQFLREVSGEAALERRMRAHGGHSRACAARTAMAEAAHERPRCC